MSDVGLSSISVLARFSTLMRSLLILAIAVPFALSFRRVIPAWDEQFFLHNAVCVSQAVFPWSLKALNTCFSEMSKSPLMALVLVPAGPLRGDPGVLGIASVVLALATFGVAICLAYIADEIRIPVWGAGLCCVSILSLPSIAKAGAPLLADGILSLVVACTVLTPFLEIESRRGSVRTEIFNDMGRGCLWGLLLACGLMLKLTYLFFAAPVSLILLFLSLRAVGIRRTIVRTLSAVTIASPALISLALYGAGYLRHAAEFSFGNLSQYYSDGVSRWDYLIQQLESPVTMLALVALLLAALIGLRRHPQRAALGLVMAGLVIVFDVIAAGSPNKDPRFFWPVWVSLPFCLAAAASHARFEERKITFATAAAISIIAAVLLSLPMYSRMDFRAVSQAQSALNALAERRARTIVVSSDTASINIETFLLAQQIDASRLGNLRISTVVYDPLHRIPLDKSIERLTAADAALFFLPDGSAPEWANRNFDAFAQVLTSEKREVVSPAGAGPINISFAPDRK